MLTYAKKEEFETTPYWKGRYEKYLGSVISYIQGIEKSNDIKRVLEIGSNGISLVKESESIDVAGNPTYKFDITKTPWPIKNKFYDLSIACQVWEHLEGKQLQAWQELKRVSKSAILTLPYMWDCKSENCHYMIDFEKVKNWTGYESYVDCKVFDSNLNRKRIMFYYEFKG